MFCSHKKQRGRGEGVYTQLRCWVSGALTKPCTSPVKDKGESNKPFELKRRHLFSLGADLTKDHEPCLRQFDRPSPSHSTFRTTSAASKEKAALLLALLLPAPATLLSFLKDLGSSAESWAEN